MYLGLPLCYDVGDYPVFVATSLWLVIILSLWRVITLSSWRQARLEAPTLHNTGKSLSVWVRQGRAKRPHAEEVLHGMLSPIAHGGDK